VKPGTSRALGCEPGTFEQEREQPGVHDRARLMKALRTLAQLCNDDIRYVELFESIEKALARRDEIAATQMRARVMCQVGQASSGMRGGSLRRSSVLEVKSRLYMQRMNRTWFTTSGKAQAAMGRVSHTSRSSEAECVVADELEV